MYNLEGGFQSSICQHWFYVLERTSKNVCHQCLCPQVSCSHLLPFQETPRSSGRSDQAPIIYLLLPPWVSEYVRLLCVPIKSEVSISPYPLGLWKLSLTGLQSQILWGLVFPVQDPQAGEANMGLESLY